MAACAALVSLMNLMEGILNHPRHFFSYHNKQIESLRKYASFLLHFIEGYTSHGARGEAESLESRIASAAYAAVDVIESNIVDQINAGSTLYGETRSRFLLSVHKVIAEMNSIKKLALMIIAETGSNCQVYTYPTSAASSKLLTKNNTMVGFDDVLFQLTDMLTTHHSGRQIIPITGMGGIGKTTLARNVYEDLLIVQHFDIRAWATVSQGYNLIKIMSQLLTLEGKSTDRTFDELGEMLHKKLSGRRYLIVLDDVWSSEVWDKIKFYFPNNDTRSRIVVTTRISKIDFQCDSVSLAMNLLDDDKSWTLFCEKVFGDESCPLELEEIGNKIVKKCKGLPLSIVVIGGHLRNSSRTKEYWEEVGDDMNSILDSGEDEQCLSILSLSYSNLPAHLKPCFLYMGVFPEDEEIRVSSLIKLWVAEGFLKPCKAQNLEDVAEVYLKDLVERNLISVPKWKRNGKVRTCNIHDLLRELCLIVSEKEKFHFDMEWPSQDMDVITCTSSDFRLMKVKFADYQEIDESAGVGRSETHFHLINLRYLDRRFIRKGFPSNIFPLKAFLFHLHLHSSISQLWNLQTFIIKDHLKRIIAPSEIWEMPRLRHLLITRQIWLPDPPPSCDFVLQNLQTLLKLENFSLSEEVCKRIPNIKRLHLLYDEDASSTSCYCLHNLVRLKQLRSLTFHFDKVSSWRDFALNIQVLSSLQKLSVSTRCLNWEDLARISLSLPHLEVLKLFYTDSSTVGQFEGYFPCLKSLIIWGAYNFNYWSVDTTHFPVLENLSVTDSGAIPEIPSGIGEISTLECIELKYCTTSAAVSAMRILSEQESYGNESLLLHVDFQDPMAEDRFWQIVQEEDLTSNNLRLKPSYRD